MMYVDNKKLVELYFYCDYIPVVSIATNIVDLFVKTVILPYKSAVDIEKNHYYTQLKYKNEYRCLALLAFPMKTNLWLANVAVVIFDLYCRKYNNKEYMLEAFKKDKYAICLYASLQLLNDRDFMLEAFKIDKGALHSSPLCANRDFIFDCVRIDPSFYRYAGSYGIENDKEISLYACKKDTNNFTFVGKKLKKDIDFINLAKEKKWPLLNTWT